MISNFQCPKGFEEEYLSFQDAFEERHYASATIKSNNNILHKYLDFLDSENVTESSGITTLHITKFLGRYDKAKTKYVATILYVMRNYLSFLYQQGFTKEDVSKQLPKVHSLRSTLARNMLLRVALEALPEEAQIKCQRDKENIYVQLSLPLDSYSTKKRTESASKLLIINEYKEFVEKNISGKNESKNPLKQFVDAWNTIYPE